MTTKILLIDDEKPIVELVTVLLQDNSDYEIHSAYDGEDGLKVMEKIRADIVLLDYMMPRMNGLEVLREIKLHWPATYVIIMTGKGSEKVAVTLMKAGASDYISKPFRADELAEIVETGVSMRKIELDRRYGPSQDDQEVEGVRNKAASGPPAELTDSVMVGNLQYLIVTRDLGSREPKVVVRATANRKKLGEKTIDYTPYVHRPNIKEIVAALIRRLHSEMIECVLAGSFTSNTSHDRQSENSPASHEAMP